MASVAFRTGLAKVIWVLLKHCLVALLPFVTLIRLECFMGTLDLVTNGVAFEVEDWGVLTVLSRLIKWTLTAFWFFVEFRPNTF